MIHARPNNRQRELFRHDPSRSARARDQLPPRDRGQRARGRRPELRPGRAPARVLLAAARYPPRSRAARRCWAAPCRRARCRAPPRVRPRPRASQPERPQPSHTTRSPCSCSVPRQSLMGQRYSAGRALTAAGAPWSGCVFHDGAKCETRASGRASALSRWPCASTRRRSAPRRGRGARPAEGRRARRSAGSCPRR